MNRRHLIALGALVSVAAFAFPGSHIAAAAVPAENVLTIEGTQRAPLPNATGVPTASSTSPAPFALTIGAGAQSAVYDWISATFTQPTSHNGSVLLLGPNRTRTRLEYYGARITELDFPALDTLGAIALGNLSVTIAPTKTTFATPDATNITTNTVTNLWQTSNFSLIIDGLTTSNVTRIEPLSVTFRPSAGTATAVSVSDLIIRVPVADAKSYIDWQDRILRPPPPGTTTGPIEKTGTLVFLSRDKKTPYFTLQLQHLMLTKYTAPATTTSTSATADIHIGAMVFTCNTPP